MADGVYSRRFQTIAQMARDAAGEVTGSEEAWKRLWLISFYRMRLVKSSGNIIRRFHLLFCSFSALLLQ